MFERKMPLEIDLTKNNPLIHGFEHIIHESLHKLPLIETVTFQLKEPLTLLLIKTEYRPVEKDVCRINSYQLRPNRLYAYELTGDYWGWWIVIREMKDLETVGQSIVELKRKPEYDTMLDIIDFALNYPVLKKVLKPEQFKSYEKLWKLLFGDVR